MNIKSLTEALDRAEQRITDANAAEDWQLLEYWRGRADSLREIIKDELDARAAVKKMVDESLPINRKPARTAA